MLHSSVPREKNETKSELIFLRPCATLFVDHPCRLKSLSLVFAVVTSISLILHLFFCLLGSGHIIYPVHRVCAARDPSEAAEEPEHSSQLQAAIPSFGPPGSA